MGGLPEDIEFELLEPLRYLFKDEVRRGRAWPWDYPNTSSGDILSLAPVWPSASLAK